MDFGKIALCVLLAAAAAVIVVLIILSVRKSVNRRKAEKLIENGKRDRLLIYRAVRAAYPGAAVFRDLKIPVMRADGTKATIRSELTVVGKSGITLITSYPYGGKIDDPFHGDWVCYGGETPLSFRNPLERGNGLAGAVSRLMSRNGLNNFPVTPLAVFLGEHLYFNHESDRVLRLDQLLDRLDGIASDSFLSAPERRAAEKVLSSLPAERQAAPKN